MENNITHQTIDNQQRVLVMDKFEFGKASNRITLNFWSISELESKLKGLSQLQKDGIMPVEE